MSFIVDTSALDDITKQLERQGNLAKEVAPRVVQAGASVLVKAQTQELSRVVNGKRTQGLLRDSIGMGKVEETARGVRVPVFPQGYQNHGNSRKGKRDRVSNAQVGFMKEYGSSTQPARPWMKPANKKSQDQVNNAMAQVWESAHEQR